MLCPACQAENAENARFCMSCGAKLAQECPQCKAQLPIQARFCPECGSPVGAGLRPAPTGAPTQESISARLQRLIPRQYAERLQALRGQASNERRLVTILFADVKGSTAMAEKLDPEEVLEIMNGAFEALIPPVYQHEGTLARLMGDAVLAFFGAPLAHEDDPERAVRVALEMVAGIKQYAARLEQERGITGFNVRVGINTGLVVVGEVGSDLRVEYTAMGDAINLAARMEQNAPVGGVLISHDTYRHVRGLFDVAVQEPLIVKGKTEPVQTYVVLRARPRQFRMATRGIEGVETRTVGREAELIALQTHFRDAIEEAQAGVITITGDAGVGKSRLLYEFENWLGLWEKPLAHFYGRATPEGQERAYSLLRSLFASRFEILETDTAAQVRQKFLDGTAGRFSPEQAEMTAQFIGFDIAAASEAGAVQDAAAMAQDALIDYFRLFSKRTGMVLLFEDVHWADMASLDFIDRLASELAQAPILIVCLARPALFEKRPNWGEGRQHYTRLELTPLSRRGARQLVAELLQKAGEIPPRLEEVILTSAEGNPFYAEELVKMFLENGVIEAGAENGGARWVVHSERLESLQVPPTLTGVLQARFDSLPPEEKLTLQRASVAGREFWDALLAALDDQAAGNELQSRLNNLRQRALIFQHERSAFQGAQEYTFKHAVLRDTVYESVLLKQRRQYHAQVAAWLEKNSGDRPGETLSLIAQHYSLAGEPEKAADFWKQAGDDASEIGDAEQALQHYERALKLTPPEQIGRRAALLVEIAIMHSSLDHDAEAKLTIEDGLALARQAEDWKTASQALFYLGLWQAFDANDPNPEKGLALLQESEQAARRADDIEGIANSISTYGILLFFQGNVQAGERCMADSLVYFRQAEEPGDEPVRLLNILARSARQRGDLAAAEAHYQEARQFIDRLSGRYARLEQLNLLSLWASAQGDEAEAERLGRKCLAMARNLGHREITFQSIERIISACHAQKKTSEIERHALKGLEYARTWKKPAKIQTFMVELGRAAQAGKDYPTAQSWFEQALANGGDELNTINEVFYFAGRCYAEMGDFPKACQLFQTALKQCPAGEDSVTLSRALFQMLEPLIQHGWAETAAEIVGVLENLSALRPKQTDLDPILAQLAAALPADAIEAAKARGQEMGLETIRLKLMDLYNRHASG